MTSLRWAAFLLAILAQVALAHPLPGKRQCKPAPVKDSRSNCVTLPAARTRPSFPWETVDQVGQLEYPGHDATVRFPKSRPVGSHDGKSSSPSPKCPLCVPYSGQANQTYIPGFGGKEAIMQPLPNDNKPFTMTLIHTNDIHARYSEFSKYGIDCSAKDYSNRACYGGIARIKTVVDHIRATEPNVYLVDAGDQFQGSLFYTYYKGNVTAEWMSMIGYDAWALGNHEFDDGPAHLAKFLKMLTIPTLSSNIDVSGQPELTDLVAPYVVLTKFNARIGVVGYITPTTPDIAVVDKVQFSDPVKPVQRAVDELRKLGVERIICVSHNGFKEDIAVAHATGGISLIVGGHSHTLLHDDNSTYPDAAGPYPSGFKNLDGEDVYIVQAKAWGEFVGHLQVSWDADNKVSHINGAPIRLTMDIPQHNATLGIVNQWRAPFDAMAKQVLARFTAPMPYSECKKRGCRLGYFVANALRAQYSGKLPGAANLPVIGMVPMGALRSSFSEVVTVGDVLSMLPYGDPWVETVVSGEYLVDLLENVAAAKHKVNGRPVTTWMQFAGLRAKMDPTKPEFARVSDVQVNVDGKVEGKWSPIDKDAKYVVVAQEFVMSGGDNVVPATLSLPKYGIMSDMLMAHIKSLVNATSGPIVVPNDPGVAYLS